jgi:hypothetical protein
LRAGPDARGLGRAARNDIDDQSASGEVEAHLSGDCGSDLN